MPTCEQVANARMLALTLEKVVPEHPEHFAMEWFVIGKIADWDDSGPVGGEYDVEAAERHAQGEHPVDCGTAGCALGWGPYATGIAKQTGESYEQYAYRVLGIGSPSPSDAMNEPEFRKLFMDFTPPNSGAEGARRAAERLWEWIAEHEADCEEGGEEP